MTARRRRAAAATALTLLAALLVTPIGPAPAVAATGDGFSQTKTLTRGSGETLQATLEVNDTKELINRQVLRLSWKGLLPSHQVIYPQPAQNASVGLQLQYPVVVLQCSKPDPAKQDCYFNRPMAQEQSNPAATWDTHQGADERDAGHVQPFQAVTRAEPYSMKPGDVPPDFGTTNFGGTAGVEPTDPDGTRSGVRFEVRDAITTPSLGCSSQRQCSLVVIPVMDLDCTADAGPSCTSGPLGPVGKYNGVEADRNQTLVASSWSLGSNWRNRFVVPLTFAPLDTACNATDARPQRAIVGSEVADMAFRSWGQKMCVDPAGPKIAHVRQGENVARIALTTQSASSYGADAALVTRPVTESPRPIGHAPVLATGFAISYAVDVYVRSDGDPKTPYEYADLRLNARLLAKLLTQSYPGAYGRNAKHPDVGANPATLFYDPEFLALNPQYPQLSQGVAGNDNNYGPEGLTVITNDSDAYYELTRYVADDPVANAWLHGEPDEHGMVVNPAWKGDELPTAQFQLRDQWVGPTTKEKNCSEMPALSSIQSTAPTLEQSVYSIVDSSPAFQVCDIDSTNAYNWIKPAREYFPQRVYLAVTSTAYASAYGLESASLQTPSGTFVAPTQAAMTKALATVETDTATGTQRIDHDKLAADAYPGTMPVYLAVPTSGLGKEEAASYADVIRRAVSDAYQTPGGSVGQLPAGYAPLPRSYRDKALAVASAVVGTSSSSSSPGSSSSTEDEDSAGDSSSSSDTSDPPAATTDPTTPPDNGSNPSAASVAGDKPAGAGPTTPVALTQAGASPLGTWALPLLLLLAVVLALASPVLLLTAQPAYAARLRALLGGRR